MAFTILNDAAALHKQLSNVLMTMEKSRLLAQFIVGSGVIESITLRSLENELYQFLTHPKVTELGIGLVTELPRIQEVAMLVFNHCRDFKIFKMDYRIGHLLQVVAMVTQAAGTKLSARCRLILGEVDVSSLRRKERVLILPLRTLDIASHEISEENSEVVERFIRASPGPHELYMFVSSVDVAQRIFDCIIQERRPMSTLSMSLPDDVMAVFSLEVGEEGGTLVVTQKITQPDLDATFFLPSAKLQRVDVVGEHIEKSHASEIAAFVLRHYCGVGSIRFVDFPDQVNDIAVVIKDSIQRGLFLQDLKRRKCLTAGTNEWRTGHYWGGVEDKSSVSSIVRARQDGTVEAIELDCTDSDGMTARINAVAFEKSDFARHPDVTRLAAVVRHGSTFIDDLASTPIFTFTGLKQLEISRLLSLDLNALLAAFEAAPTHPALKQIQIWCADQSYNRIAFDLPIKTLDLSCVKSFGAFEQLHLHGEVGSILSIWFNPEASDMVSVVLSSMEIQDSMLSSDQPVLRMMEFTDTTLELIEAIQAATVDNPGLQSLALKDCMSGPRLMLEIPFRKIDLGKQAIPLVRVKSLKRLLLACPQLTELCLPLDSVADLHEAVTIFGPVFQKHKKLTDIRLTLQNGTEASIRYSGKDGSLPMVKKITIRPRDTSLWRDASDITKELAKILAVYKSLETLEFDCGVTSPFAALLLLQSIVTKQSQIQASPHLRRYRHRTYDFSPGLITHDLPLVKLDLGDFFVSVGEFSVLSDLVLSSPKLVDLRMSFPTNEAIDTVYTKLSNGTEAFGRLTRLTIKSWDGYGIAFQWTGLTAQDNLRITQSRVASRRNVESAELQVSGTEWPPYFERFRTSVSKLTILPKTSDRSSAVTDNSKSFGDILSIATHEYQDIKHIDLTCPVYRFYELSSSSITISLITVADKIDLHDPTDITKKILTGYFEPEGFSSPMSLGSLIIVHLENIADEAFIDSIGVLFEWYHLTVEIVDYRQPAGDGVGEWLEVKPHPDKVLYDSLVARLLIKLLVRKATEIDVEYESMVALIPFIKDEIGLGGGGGPHAIGAEGENGPFMSLRKYDIRVVQDPAKEKDLKAFGALIPRTVEHKVHGRVVV
ncbi:MAG: hypothetical protein J3R72DRAFT_473283 [Linnemannia gamsii]|nr:MAG: hypothetical protein J3R72DRAFT_473283 [Linnemannia gamsii]